MSNVKKPTIPAEVADAIEYFRNRGDGLPAWSNEGILDHVINSAAGSSYIETLRTIPFDTLMAALVNGYRRELSNEEQERKRTYTEIARTHQRHCEGIGRYDTFPEDYAFADGIQYTLDMLGISLEVGA